MKKNENLLEKCKFILRFIIIYFSIPLSHNKKSPYNLYYKYLHILLM